MATQTREQELVKILNTVPFGTEEWEIASEELHVLRRSATEKAFSAAFSQLGDWAEPEQNRTR